MRRLAPGMYVNDSGELHLDVPELLRAHGYADTQENRDRLAEVARSEIPKLWPATKVTVIDKPGQT